MTSPQRSLHPAGGDDRGSLLGTFEFVACRGVQFAQIVGAVVGQRVALEPGPQILDWIEVWGIGRQEGDLDVPTQRIEIVAHQTTAVRLQPIPDHQQRLLEMDLERLEEPDHLFLLDAALVQPEQAVGAREAGC